MATRTPRTLPTWEIRITEFGVRGLSYAGRAAARDANGARALVVALLARHGIRVPYGAIVHCARAGEASERAAGFVRLVGP